VCGETGEFVEEILEVGTVQDEVLDLVDGAEGFTSEDFFGMEHGAWSPGCSKGYYRMIKHTQSTVYTRPLREEPPS
jgi:hypothetical protein